ncbi:hypothetical protein [Pectobacterium versatile]|uniref:hypothetical protein n=1 Tax=Pectobacterium versatile TaxID=2488639 RepID=UPI001F44CBD4|nr:hypothetical protein [Pectobacterium versatile]
MEQNKYRRAINHLETKNCSEDDIIYYLECVEESFGFDWLVEKGNHKLQILWQRRDALSTNELFAIGKAIKSLKNEHEIWLKKTIANIKKQPEGAHGFIAEIILASSITADKSKTTPAPANKPGYDISINGENGKNILISVKNHDISKHYKDFLKHSEKIRGEFIRIINNLKISARLIVCFLKPISKDLYKECVLLMHFKVKGYGNYCTDDGIVNIRVIPINDFDGKPTITGSELCIITAPFHKNEHIGFKSKLTLASENMKKHLPKNSNTLRLLFMRLHHAADIKLLGEIANNMIISDENCGFDQVMLIQPSVARTPDGRSTIHTCFNFSQIIRSTPERNILDIYKDIGHIRYAFPVGTFSNSPTNMIIMDENKLGVELEQSYIYQMGIIKTKAESRSDGSYWGELSSPASGIHVVSCFDVDGQSFTLGAIKPENEELLLI